VIEEAIKRATRSRLEDTLRNICTAHPEALKDVEDALLDSTKASATAGGIKRPRYLVCVNPGCYAEFDVLNNHEKSCDWHTGRLGTQHNLISSRGVHMTLSLGTVLMLVSVQVNSKSMIAKISGRTTIASLTRSAIEMNILRDSGGTAVSRKEIVRSRDVKKDRTRQMMSMMQSEGRLVGELGLF